MSSRPAFKDLKEGQCKVCFWEDNKHDPGCVFSPEKQAAAAAVFKPESLAISSHLPDLINNYISIRAQRLALDKQAASMKDTENDIAKVIISKFRDGNITAQGASNGLIKMTEYVEPIAEEWTGIWAYIEENQAWDLVHKRLTITAVKDRWDAGVEIPGVGRVTKYKLSVSGAE